MGADSAPLVLVFYFDAGGGHRAAARALATAAETAGNDVRIRLANLQAILAPLDFTRWITGRPLDQTYNTLLRRGWTGFLVPLLRGLQGLIGLLQGPLARRLARHLAGVQPDLVVSVLPNLNRVIRDAVRRALPGRPFVVVLTDYADFPPHFWIEADLDRVVVGSEHAQGQALAAGVAPERITCTSGMILHPRFYEMGGARARSRVRRELEIGEGELVVLALFGGIGRPEMAPLAERILSRVAGIRMVAIAGDNPRLLERLRVVETAFPGRLHPTGFTDRVVDYMAASDLLVTKPGPGSLAEAFQQRLPVIVTLDRCTIPQERFNAEMIRDQQLGIVVSRWQEIPEAVAGLVGAPERLRELSQRVAALPENRAVFEVLQILEREAHLAPAVTQSL